MNVGFVVMAHSDPRLLGALLQELSPYPTFLHVDRPQISAEYLAKAGVGTVPGLVLSERVRCLHWGGYSILQAMLETLDLALKSTGSETKHIAFLSGQCFPLRPVEDFARYVRELDRPVLCRAVGLDGDREMGPGRVTGRHWLDGPVGHAKKVGPSRLVGLARRGISAATVWPPVRVPHFVHACGSQWTCLPRELAEEIVSYYNRGGFDYLRNAYAPDEVAIPSFIYNSDWLSKTQVGALENVAGRDVSSFPNFHWLRPGLQGVIGASEIEQALVSDNFFIRKLAPSNFELAIAMIKHRQ
ncbi:beta-1,6-N-acetylglucosaminyltransferase [Kocuria arenosa]|uniref:beta-1,6-N-acetylglucosaminyltransferase n=1 Tax=Kocuria arenosa TaxID=3071446 RepID=UPI0034D53F18